MDRLILTLPVLLSLLLDIIEGRKYQNGRVSTMAQPLQATLAVGAPGGDKPMGQQELLEGSFIPTASVTVPLSLPLLPTSKARLTLQFYLCCWKTVRQFYM